MDLSILTIAYISLAAFFVGFSKTSVGGAGVIAVLLMALAFPGKASVGILLPMLIVGDIIAVIYYKRNCDWKIILKMFPLTALGVIIGYFVVDVLSQEVFNIALGLVILTMLVIGHFLEDKTLASSSNKIVSNFVGLLAGMSSMLANAAGPLVSVYFLQLKLPKLIFVGTASWYFLLINVFKIPFSSNLGLITWETLTLNLLYVPIILLGAYVGVRFLRKIDMRFFTLLVKIASLLVSVKLIFF
ncbi:MAG: sulfite exporter TauE/SafE family protein [Campylobacteraceae bacterium]|nr:sulfite exporter TauE/SafE family protein [Campylobacteraceae bacterium]